MRGLQFVLTALFFATVSVLASPAPVLCGPAAADNSYYDGFADLDGLDPFRSFAVERDALGGVRLKGNGPSKPKPWTAQDDFLSSISYKPILEVTDNPLIPLGSLDPLTLSGSLRLPTTPYAFRRVQPDPVLLPADPASVDGYGVGGMCVRRVDLDYRYYMWYTGVPENEFSARIYLAKSNDGLAWVRSPKIDSESGLEVPVLDLGEPGSFDARQLGKPSVHYDPAGSPKFKMWYTAEGDLTGSIGYATSEDGVNWDRWIQPIATADGPGDVGQHASLAVGADGLPLVAYYDATNGDLKLAHCGNAFCTEGNTVVSLDLTGDVGQYASLAVGADGLPLVAYYDATNGDLKAFHCGTASCTVGNTVTTLDGGDGTDVGQYASLAISGTGLPVVAYYDVTNGNLKLVACNDYSCAGGDDIASVVDGTAGDAGRFASLDFIVTDPLNPQTSAMPAIAYYDPGNTDLKFVACNDPACADGDETPVVLDSAGDVGSYASLAIGADGLPLVSYYDATNGDLRFVACTDMLCADADEAPVTLDGTSGSDVGRFSSIIVGADGLPVIAYYDATDGNLLTIACEDPTCSGGDEAPLPVDEDGDVGQFVSLASGPDARPLLAYYDAVNGDLRLSPAVRVPAAVLGPGLIGSIDGYSVAHPAVIFDKGTYRMWYTANDSNNRRIAYASSGDGVTWARGGLVIDLENTANDKLGAWSPSVTKTGTGYYMVYTGWKQTAGGNTLQSKLITATSDDGTTWDTGNIAENPGNVSSFDGTNLSQGSIIYDPADAVDPYKMWYVGNTVDDFGNSHDRIGLLVKANSGGWNKVGGGAGLNSVLNLGPQGAAFDSMHAFDLRVVEEGGALLGFYTGTKGADFKERIGLKGASDGGLTWTDHLAPGTALISAGGTGAFDEGGVLTPAPVRTADGWLIYHTALNADRNPVVALHTATADFSVVTRIGTPVVEPGAGFDAGGCADPYVVAVGSAMTMFYAGSDSLGTWSVGAAGGDTDAPQTFTGRVQILAPGPEPYDLGGLRRPVVLHDGATGTWHLWYQAIGTDGIERIAHASSADGLTWAKDGLAAAPSTAPFDFAEKGVWPASVWTGASGVSLAFTGVDRFGWRRTGLAAAAGPGVTDGGTATFQHPDDATLADPAYLPRDWRQISWNPTVPPEGAGMEVWVSYYPTYSGLWSNFFPIDNLADLPFLLSVKGMRWQVRMAGSLGEPAATPQLDDLAVDNADIAFPPSGQAVTIPLGPPAGRYLLAWEALRVKSEIPTGGTLSVTIADQDGTPIEVGLPVTTSDWEIQLASIPATSGRLQLVFTLAPDTTVIPPESPLLRSMNVTFSSTDVPSSLTLWATPAPLPYGGTATLSGALMSDATPLAGQTVTLKYRLVTDSAYTDLGTVVTADDGTFAWSAPIAQDNDTIYRAEWGGGDVDGTIYPPAMGSFTLEMSPATLLFQAGVNPILHGKATTLRGSLSTIDGPLAGQTVTIRYRATTSQDFSPLGTVVTRADGTFSWPVAVAPRKSTVYEAAWGERSATAFTLGVKPVIGITVTNYASRLRSWYRYPLGRSVSIKGTVAPNHRLQGDGVTPGQVTVVVERYLNRAWGKIAETVRTLSSTSGYRLAWRPRARGKYRVRTLFLGDADHSPGASVNRAVLVY